MDKSIVTTGIVISSKIVIISDKSLFEEVLAYTLVKLKKMLFAFGLFTSN